MKRYNSLMKRFPEQKFDQIFAEFLFNKKITKLGKLPTKT